MAMEFGPHGSMDPPWINEPEVGGGASPGMVASKLIIFPASRVVFCGSGRAGAHPGCPGPYARLVRRSAFGLWIFVLEKNVVA